MNFRLPEKNSFLHLSYFLTLFFIMLSFAGFATAQNRKDEKQKPKVYQLTPTDKTFLEDLERRAFLYFWEQSDAETGLTLDRARTDGTAHPSSHPSYNIASIGAEGFGLSGLCIAADTNWVTPAEARQRARISLDFLLNRAPHKNGWFYHWMDKPTGARRWTSEISSVDSALLLGGVLTVRQCFADDKEIVNLATQIYERVDFSWMLAGSPNLFSHGWKPETGFLTARWKDYSEQMLLYILAVGSPTHPVSPDVWDAWQRDWRRFYGYRYLAAASPLFIHQFSHAWIDFRGKRESRPPHTDYFENSVKATKAHKAFFQTLSKEFPGYSENVWGLTASDSRRGYIAWGAPPREPAIDGTVVPCASAGSLMFAPEITLPALQEMKNRFGKTIYGRYGFTDAFNPNNGWVNPDVIGIDVGITLLSAENLRTGKVWQWFMKNPEAKLALQKIKIR
ncbi:MAG: hypothetical protein M3Q33_08360 [Acidobacteriota bacterium]|nr:hypothetical protein [Acidobacteriota bacterium]